MYSSAFERTVTPFDALNDLVCGRNPGAASGCEVASFRSFSVVFSGTLFSAGKNLHCYLEWQEVSTS